MHPLRYTIFCHHTIVSSPEHKELLWVSFSDRSLSVSVQSITQSTHTNQPTTKPNSIKLYRNLHFMPLYKNATEGVKIDQTTTTTTVNTSPRSTTQNSMIFDRKLPCMTSLKIQQSVLIEQQQ